MRDLAGVIMIEKWSSHSGSKYRKFMKLVAFINPRIVRPLGYP